MPDNDQLISISECARQLAAAGDRVSRPGLSLYCDQHNLKIGGTDKRPLVNFNQVLQHRSANGLRTIMRGEGLPDQPAVPADTPAAAETPAAEPEKVTRLPSLEERRRDPVFRKREIEAEQAEIELQRVKGALVSVAEVEAGLADAVASLRQAGAQGVSAVVDSVARDLHLNDDGRGVLRQAFKRYFREVQEAFHADAVATQARLASDDRSAVRDRLNAMTRLGERLRGQERRSRRSARRA